MVKWQPEFPPEIQAQREPILAALHRAMNEQAVEAVREARSLASAWMGQHPEDVVICDTGDPIAMLADAVAWMEAQKDREEMEEWKRHKAEKGWHSGRQRLPLTLPRLSEKKAGLFSPRPHKCACLA